MQTSAILQRGDVAIGAFQPLTALTEALLTNGALGVEARLTPYEREASQVRFGARLAAVIDAHT